MWKSGKGTNQVYRQHMFLCVVYQVYAQKPEGVELQPACPTLGGRPRKFKYIIIIYCSVTKFRISFESDVRRQAVNFIKTARTSVAGKTFLI